MLAKAATVSNARKHKTEDTQQQSAEDIQKDRDMFLADSVTYKNFWIGVLSASVIQKEKLVRGAKKTKFKRNLGPKLSIGPDKIYAEHSKEVSKRIIINVMYLTLNLSCSFWKKVISLILKVSEKCFGIVLWESSFYIP
jgi:hypothetical protein